MPPTPTALLDFLALTLAAGYAANVWLMRGSLFEGPRERLKVWAEPVEGEDPDSRTARFRGHVGHLARCRVCLTGQAACWAALLLFLPALFAPAPWDAALKLPVYALAAARLSVLIADSASEEDRDDTIDDTAGPGDGPDAA
jgi:hypothetical protein